jgi:streptogramin lyase
MAIGSDGSFWGIDGEKGIWHVDVADDGMVPTRFPSKSYSISSTWMTRGSDGNLWFSETAGCAVGRIDMDGVFNDDFETCP